MIKVVDQPAKIRKFLTYDLEWFPDTMQLRLIGVFDGARYRHYLSVQAFLDAELTRDARGKWFYAHAGGLADIQYLLEVLIEDPTYEVDCMFSGSSAVIVKVKRGKDMWYFVDSYWLLRDKLRNIGKWLGMDKGGADGDTATFFAEMKELIEYNEQDCVILWQAINQFQITLMEIGGQLQMTLASSALMLFRRRFLERDIQTSRKLNALARSSYHASRVEPYRRKITNGYIFDINSSFPYAMTFPAPGAVKRSTKRRPTSDGALYMADCEVRVPDMYLPPIPYRPHEAGKVYYPVGSWRSWFMNVDLELLESQGGRVEKVHEVIEFEQFHGLAEYATTLYDKRKKAEKGGMEDAVWKLLLNSCYGKFAEGNSKQRLRVNPASTRCMHNPPCVSYDRKGEIIHDACMEMLMPGVFLITEEKPIPHQCVPIASNVTAIARRTLFNSLKKCEADVAYTDTDSVFTKTVLPTGTELGDMKLEHLLVEAEFLQCKLYSATVIDPKDDTKTQRKVKAKGFSRMTADSFDLVADGFALNIERMTRVKEIFRAGASTGMVTPGTKNYMKEVRASEQTKRKMFRNGTSRPWHVDELNGDMTDRERIDI